MTIQTNTRNLIGSTTMKALAVSLLVLAMMTASLLAPTRAQASAFPGKNGKIVFTSDRTTGTGVNNPEGDLEIFTMNPDGTGLKQLTKNVGATDASPSYSPDGKKMVFQSQRTGNFEIFVMNADGTGQKNLTKNPARELDPSYSPDGKKILFESDRNDPTSVFHGSIFVMNSDGTQQTALTSDPADDTNATFSPNGNKIAFERSRGDFSQGLSDSDIVTMNADGTGQTRITDNSFEDVDPSFSPDGNKIAFASNRDGGGDSNDFDVFVMSTSGTGTIRLTNSRATDAHPAFSPDGQKVAYDSNEGGDEEILITSATSATGAPITSNTRSDLAPDWQPTATTFTVTTATDLGDGVCDSQCTLREAINTSNNTPGPGANSIKFNIPGSGVQTITPVSVLPPITRPAVIDGYTQPGSSPNTLATGDNAVLRIELNGTNIPGANGLTIQGTSGGSVIKGLVINRFSNGIAITGDTVGNRVEGNFIGTDPTGTLDRGNLNGVAIFNGPSGNVVGGTTPAARNILSGNDNNGGIVVITANGNQIRGNYVGTDKSGTKDLGNQGVGGIYLSDADGNIIGGTMAASRNVVSGNDGDGIDLDSGSNENKVLGNRVGTMANGTGALGNGFDGIFVLGSNNQIGDGTSGGSNAIAFNGNDGVDILATPSSASTGNEISRNSIISNDGLGIDLRGGFEDASGNTANDPGDIDSGPNGLQNKPALTSAKNSSTKTTIAGRINSTPGKTFKVQFFSSPSGTDEGKTFIGQKSVTTDGSGIATFTFSPASKVPAGRTITATATDPAGNTSEFSAPRTVALSTGSGLSPETTKVSGPSGVTKSPAAHFRFESPDPDATFECSLDGGAYYECTSPENINRLSEGRHTFEVRAMEEEGTVDPSPAAWIWAVERNR